MRKITKIVLIITCISLMFSFAATYSIFGKNLFYYDSQWGYVFAISYRWLYIINIFLMVCSYLLLGKSKSKKENKNNENIKIVDTEVCIICAKPRVKDYKFCSKCGTKFSVEVSKINQVDDHVKINCEN